MKIIVVICALLALSATPQLAYAGCQYKSVCTTQFCGIVQVCCDNGVCIVTPQ